LRIDGIPGGAIVLNSAGVAKANSPIGKQDEDLVNSFAFDWIDHYLLEQSQGTATRVLGPARLPDPTAATPTVWNVVAVADTAQVQGRAAQMIKEYGFSFISRRLESVSYSLSLQGAILAVQTRFSDWQSVQQQWVPGKITRLENGIPTFSFVLGSATFGPTAADGAFDHP
jgi:hypothetical protein